MKTDRIDRLLAAVAKLAAGGREVRIPISDSHDEVDAIAAAINGVADQLARRPSRKTLRASETAATELLHVLTAAQDAFIADRNPRLVFEEMLSPLLGLTSSEYGFIGEVRFDEAQMPYLKTHALTNIAWNDDSRRLYQQSAAGGFEFRNLTTLFGAAMTTGEPVVSNDPADDPRSGGVPPGHPALRSFLGLPFFRAGKMVGMVGIANRPGGYDQSVIDYLAPFLATCAGFVEAHRSDQRRVESERALLRNEVRLRQAEKMEALGTLASGISHDFNNILSPIGTYAYLLAQDQPLSDRKDMAEQVTQATQRAAKLVRQILSFARPEDEGYRAFDIVAVVREVLDLLRASLPSAVRIAREADDEPVMILGDPTQLHQAVLNLGINADHAMRVAGGVLTVCVGVEDLSPEHAGRLGVTPGPHAAISVSDTGTGIRPKDLERVFDPFFTTKPAGTGSGMGLATVHGIVRRHGGSVDVESRERVGTTFRVWIPLADTPTPTQSVQTTHETVAGLRVLLVDDEPAISQATKRLLVSAGSSVADFQSSPAALTAFRAAPDEFDVGVFDVRMPKLSGTSLARDILSLRGDFPIILVTGHASGSVLTLARGAGIWEVLDKPYAPAALFAAIRRAVDSRAP